MTAKNVDVLSNMPVYHLATENGGTCGEKSGRVMISVCGRCYDMMATAGDDEHEEYLLKKYAVVCLSYLLQTSNPRPAATLYLPGFCRISSSVHCLCGLCWRWVWVEGVAGQAWSGNRCMENGESGVAVL